MSAIIKFLFLVIAYIAICDAGLVDGIAKGITGTVHKLGHGVKDLTDTATSIVGGKDHHGVHHSDSHSHSDSNEHGNHHGRSHHHGHHRYPEDRGYPTHRRDYGRRHHSSEDHSDERGYPKKELHYHQHYYDNHGYQHPSGGSKPSSYGRHDDEYRTRPNYR